MKKILVRFLMILTACNGIKSLGEILPLIAPNFDEIALWKQVFEYLTKLMSTSIPTSDCQTFRLE